MGEVHAGFEQELFEKWVAHLHSGSSLRAGVVQLRRRERRAVDAVATRVGANKHQAVSRALGPSSHEAVDPNQANTHRVDERVVRVALVEINLATDGRNADAVAVPAD